MLSLSWNNSPFHFYGILKISICFLQQFSDSASLSWFFQPKQTKTQNGEWELFKVALVANNRNQMGLASAKERNFTVRCRGDSGNQAHEQAMGKVSRNDRNWGEEGCRELEEWCFSFFPLLSIRLMGCLCLSFLRLAFFSHSVQMVGAWQPATAAKPTSYHANHRRDWPSASLCSDSPLLQIGPWLKQLWVRDLPPVWSNMAKEWGQCVQSGVSCCWPLTPIDSCRKVMSKWKTLQRESRTWNVFPAILHTGMTEAQFPSRSSSPVRPALFL